MKCSLCSETNPANFTPQNNRCRPCQAAYMRERRGPLSVSTDVVIDALAREGILSWRYRLKPGRTVRFPKAVRICRDAGLDPHLIGV